MVIYQINPESPNQLYIIGLSHRDSLTYLNGDHTSKIQAEVYKIGDWLIHQQGLELLLPEGFFKSTSAKREVKKISAPDPRDSCALWDMKALEERLSDESTYVNAEMLLKETHALRLAQVEDKALYDAMRKELIKLVDCRNAGDYAVLKSNVEYLNERRTATMLQKIPEIVNGQFQQGSIKNRKAILTVGLYHLHEIIGYLNEDKISIRAPRSAPDKGKGYSSDVNLLKEHFGVTVILPKTLLDDQKVLEINQLDQIVKKCMSSPSAYR